MSFTGLSGNKKVGWSMTRGWFEGQRDLVTAVERIVYVSVESARFIEGLTREVRCFLAPLRNPVQN